MNRARTTSLLAQAVIFAGCGRGDSLPATDERAIRDLDQAYVVAWVRDDTAGVLATLADDGVIMPGGIRPLTTRREIQEFWWPRDGSRTRVTAYTTSIDEIRGTGSLAFVRGTGTVTFAYEKDSVATQQTTHNMTLTIVVKGSDGRWRISRRMWAPVAP